MSLPQAWADRKSIDECSPVDLRDAHPQLGDYLRRPLQQDDLQSCYAYSTAELLSFQLGQPVSAIDISLMYDYNRENSDLGSKGGKVSTALKQIRDRGACSENEIASNQKYLDLGFRTQLIQLQKCVERVGSGFFRIEQILNPMIGTPEYYCRSITQALFPSVDIRALYQSMQQIRYNNSYEFYYYVTEQACPSRQRISIPSSLRAVVTKKRAFFWSRDLLETIGAELERGNPIAFSYRVDQIRADRDSSVLHSSIIVARQWIDGQCRYLVKNSWGTDCSLYAQDIRPYCIAQEGSYWITDEKLDQVIVDTTAFH